MVFVEKTAVKKRASNQMSIMFSKNISNRKKKKLKKLNYIYYSSTT